MSLKSSAYELLYLRPCRAYARYVVGDRPADAVYRFLCSIQFMRVHRFWPNFVHPRKFSEKVWSRMLHDRDPLLTVLNDKLGCRGFVKERIGSEYLIPLLWAGNSAREIPFDTLPDRFALKASHGNDYNILVFEKANLDREVVQKQVDAWLRQNYCLDVHLGVEWGYKNIKPQVMIEELLVDNDSYPIDYKFWCFSGRVETVTVHFDRFGTHSTRGFSRDFEEGGLGFQFPTYQGQYAIPPNHRQMVRLAESLAEGFDFMRVDLYNIDGRIYFGEMTPYPGGVSTEFRPRSLDASLGAKWRFPQADS